MTDLKNQLIFVPLPISRLIPLYNGDKCKLNLFLCKCEYVIDMYKGNEAQNLYLFHTVTSRLVDKAEALLSAREDIKTWSQLKDLLIENYGDPRSGDSIAVEFESLKIKPYQSLLHFYNLLQATHKTLISKIDTQDESARSENETLYNKMALNVLMNNLPDYLVRILRSKSPNSLEEAYSIVQEEISFFKQYSKKKFTVLNTVPEFQCFYPPGIVLPFYQQPPYGPKIGFGSPSSQVQSANHNKESNGSALLGSPQSQPKNDIYESASSGVGTLPLAIKSQMTSLQDSPSSLKKLESIDKNMKSDFHDDVDEVNE